MEQKRHEAIKAVPKYYRVKLLLIDAIKKGDYPPHSRLPSESQLMNTHGISSITARRVRHELEKEGLIRSIQGKGSFVKESRTAIKQQTGAIRNKTIVFIMSTFVDEFYAPMLRGILNALQNKGYKLEVYYSKESYCKELKYLRICLEEEPAGILFVPSSANRHYQHLLSLRRRNIPVVFIDRIVEHYHFDSVASDNVKAAMNLTEYLLKQGHRKIAVIQNNFPAHSSLKDRLKGYRLALKRKGVRPDNNLIQFDDKQTNGKILGYRKTRQLIKKNIKFTAVFAANIYMARGVYLALKENGLTVPGDVSLVTFDDNELTRNFQVPLTTVKQDTYRMGYYAAKLLIRKIEMLGNRKVSLPEIPAKTLKVKTKLLIRDSCAPPESPGK